jgi:hypothetical protein
MKNDSPKIPENTVFPAHLNSPLSKTGIDKISLISKGYNYNAIGEQLNHNEDLYMPS